MDNFRSLFPKLSPVLLSKDNDYKNVMFYSSLSEEEADLISNQKTVLSQLNSQYIKNVQIWKSDFINKIKNKENHNFKFISSLLNLFDKNLSEFHNEQKKTLQDILYHQLKIFKAIITHIKKNYIVEFDLEDKEFFGIINSYYDFNILIIKFVEKSEILMNKFINKHEISLTNFTHNYFNNVKHNFNLFNKYLHYQSMMYSNINIQDIFYTEYLKSFNTNDSILFKTQIKFLLIEKIMTYCDIIKLMDELNIIMDSDSMFSEKDAYDIDLFGSYKSNLYPIYQGSKIKSKDKKICGKLEHDPKKSVKPENL